MVDAVRSIVGDLINFRGLVYAPVNENGVVFLFGKVAEDLNMYVEEIKPGFPDCVARRFTGKGWERVRVEFEYTSRQFQQHKHDPNECDVIICWEHDWKDCPLEVIELKDRIKEMRNRPIERPGEGAAGTRDGDISEWFVRHKVTEPARKLFDRLKDYTKSLNDACFFKVGERLVSFYSPERVFLYLYPRRTMLRVIVFTGGRPLGGFKQFEYEKGAEKWGGLGIPQIGELRRDVAQLSRLFSGCPEG